MKVHEGPTSRGSHVTDLERKATPCQPTPSHLPSPARSRHVAIGNRLCLVGATEICGPKPCPVVRGPFGGPNWTWNGSTASCHPGPSSSSFKRDRHSVHLAKRIVRFIGKEQKPLVLLNLQQNICRRYKSAKKSHMSH